MDEENLMFFKSFRRRLLIGNNLNKGIKKMIWFGAFYIYKVKVFDKWEINRIKIDIKWNK